GRGQRVIGLRLLQPRQHLRCEQRLRVGLDRGQIVKRVLGFRREQLLDALVPIRRRPFIGEVVRIVRRHHALVGGRDPTARAVARIAIAYAVRLLLPSTSSLMPASEMIGPWRDSRTVKFTSGLPRTLITSSRVFNGTQPSGVCTWLASAGCTRSM